MKKSNKRLIIGLIIAVFTATGIYLFRGVFAFIIFFMSMASSSKKELVKNYQLNKTSIAELKENFGTIVPIGFTIYIEFKNKNHIDLWVYENADSTHNKMNCLFQQWDINPFDYKMKLPTKFDSSEYAPKIKDLESIKAKLHWTDSTFIKINNLLKKANCISVENGNPTKIGFARSGMGKYFYYLFNDSIPDSEINKWNDKCSYIYYEPKVVLVYAGGAFGSQCFPDPK